MTSIPKNAPLVYVSFSAEINPSTTEGLIAVMASCANEQVKKVYLLLSTSGGKVSNGLNIYGAVKGMPFEVVTHNVGNVDSIGIAPFLAGSTRYACKHSTFMFHGVGFTAQQQQRFEVKDLEERLSSLKSDEERIGKIITENTKVSENEVAEIFKQGQTKDSEFAVEKGIIHEIREVTITDGCPVISLVFKR